MVTLIRMKKSTFNNDGFISRFIGDELFAAIKICHKDKYIHNLQQIIKKTCNELFMQRGKEIFVMTRLTILV